MIGRKETIVNREEDQLLTVHEVAAYLRIDPESIRRWLRSGKLSGINLGRGSGWRVRMADLREFLADRHTEQRDGHSLRTVVHATLQPVGD